MTGDESEGWSALDRPSSRSPLPPAADPSPWDPMDEAVAAYLGGDRDAVLVMRTDVGGEEDVPVALFFRTSADMPGVERIALAEARGRVLDLGAGPGAFAIPLSRRGIEVTALEVLAHARAFMVEEGVGDVRAGGLDALADGETFDTVLVLMNGLGLAETLGGLAPFLSSLRSVLAPSGQVLMDSTDPRAWADPDDGRYPGEVHMQLEFRGRAGDPFPFLFADRAVLAEAAASAGLDVEVLAEEEDGRYLARLTAS